MTQDEVVSRVAGAVEIVNWFGSWPSFHDAEILEIDLHRTGNSKLIIHAFQRLPETDESGHYKTHKHAVVTFALAEIEDLEVLGFGSQNVTLGLGMIPSTEAIEFRFGGCGMDGFIRARRALVSLVPGIPNDSMYARLNPQEVQSP